MDLEIMFHSAIDWTKTVAKLASNPFHASNSPNHKKEHIASSGSNQFLSCGEGLETRQ
jgi:hypothetical protein